MKKYFSIGILIAFVSCNIILPKNTDQVKTFYKGDVETLSEYFNVRLQININENEYMCSKAQAKKK